MCSGHVYLIYNTLSYHYYVGQTTMTLDQRWRGHLTDARNHATKSYLHNAIRKYGEDAFQISSLVSVDAPNKIALKSRLDDLEVLWIVALNSCDSKVGYNMTFGGEGGTPTAEVRRKIGDANRGRKWTEEQRRKVKERKALKPHPNKGQKLPPYQIEALRKTHIGKPLSAETKARISAGLKVHYDQNLHWTKLNTHPPLEP